MAEKAYWLLAFVLVYAGYSVLMASRGLQLMRARSDYFIAGRKVNTWVLVLAATAASFTGWTFIGHPGLIFRDGFAYAYISFYAIVIPFTGVIFLKRLWMLGKRFGYVTPGEMLSDYFKGDTPRLLAVLVAVLFAVPYVAVQLAAAGYLLDVLTDGAMPPPVGMSVLAVAMVLYVIAGGMRSLVYVDSVQCLLLAIGFVAIGWIALDAVGGVQGFLEGLARLAGTTASHPSSETTRSLFAVPATIELTAGVGDAEGGPWTATMVLTFLWAVMGIQAGPAFMMWAFGATDPRPFARQQVWASAFGIGLLLIVFAAIQGMGGHMLGGNPEANRDPGFWEHMIAQGSAEEIHSWQHQTGPLDLHDPAAWQRALDDPRFARLLQDGRVLVLLGDGSLADQRTQGQAALTATMADGAPMPEEARVFRVAMPEVLAEKPDLLIPYYIDIISGSMPWLVGLLAVCALVAMQAVGAAYLATTGAILTRDLYRQYLNPQASFGAQRLFGRLTVVGMTVGALLVATTTTDPLVYLGGFAVAFGTQMWVALAAVCFFPWLTREGVAAGLAAGLLAVILTEPPGLAALEVLGLDAWGRWPLTIHSAGWGMLVNAAIAVLVSVITYRRADHDHRRLFHGFLREAAAIPRERRRLAPWAWAATIVWTFLAVGPGILLGNSLFGPPGDPARWTFGIPSIWAWQSLFWVLGVGLIWLLAVRLQLSTVPEGQMEELLEDVAD